MNAKPLPLCILRLLALVASVALSPTAPSAAAPPNFLVILADDLGYSDLGCYGSEIATPNLDSLAENGLRYSQFYNTARCWPTRAALLTGYYAQQVNRDALLASRKGSSGKRPVWGRLLPDLLRPYGYHSYLSGKWHLDGKAAESRFERTYVLDDHNRFFTVEEHELDGQSLPPKKRDDHYYATTAVADYAIEFLRTHHEERPHEPFFQYVAFTSPHFPLQAPANDIARYASRYDAGWDAIRIERWQRMRELQPMAGELSALEPHIGPPYPFPDALAALGPGEVNRELPWASLNNEQRAFQSAKMAVHAAMVDRMDREIGRILDELRRNGDFENTLILFLSDNGASAEIMVRGDGHDRSAAPGSAESFLCLGPGWSSAANTPFRRHKTWVHEGGIATPLIVHWPAGINASGAWRSAPGHVIDIAPTLLELAGGPWPTQVESIAVPPSPGESLTATFEHDAPRLRNTLWWLHEGNRAIRVGDWKLVAARGEPWELYNLAEDRAEQRNRADEFPEQATQLANRWEDFAAHVAESTLATGSDGQR